MKNIILFGASKLGEIAFIMLRDKYNIIKYCDNDKRKKGNKINGIEIIHTDELNKYHFDNIIICSQYYKEISQQLIGLGIYNYEIFRINFNPLIENIDTKDDLDINEIDLGKFLRRGNKEIALKDLTFFSGESRVLDYAFLKALMLEFNLKTYLEIGSFLGTSISIISEIADACYSITLPDENLEEYFRAIGKKNFASYFMKDKDNIICFKENSRKFDYSKIKNKIELVFIDGDHSYEGIYYDTKNIFNFIDLDNTIVVWHDFKSIDNKYRMNTVRAIYSALPKKFHKRIFAVDNNMCGVYIPDKYISNFKFNVEKDILYSYKIRLISND